MKFVSIREFIARHKVLTAIVLAILIGEGGYIVSLPPLARDLYLYKSFYSGNPIEAAAAVQFHFKHGQTKKDALAYVEAQGFKVHRSPMEKQARFRESHKNTYAAVYSLRSGIGRIFFMKDEAAVYLQFDDDDKLMRSYAYVYLPAPL